MLPSFLMSMLGVQKEVYMGTAKKIVVTISLTGMIAAAAVLAEQYRESVATNNKYEMLEVSAFGTEEGESPSNEQEPQVPTVAATEEADIEVEDDRAVSSVNFDELPEECIGWLRIDAIDLSFPLMQGVDNQFYLNHDFEGKADKQGSIFMDCNTSIEDVYSIVYGHNMTRTKTMFNSLYDVEVGDTMILTTPDNGDEEWVCVSKYETTKFDAALELGWGENDVQRLVDAACDAANSSRYEVDGHKVMSLVTCDRTYAKADGRLICMFVQK